jgi:hypothetical protein
MLIGVGLLAVGVSLLQDDSFLFGGILHRLDEIGQPLPFFSGTLARYVEPHMARSAYLVAGGLILTGAAFTLGLLVSWAAVGGAVLAMLFGLATGHGNAALLGAAVGAAAFLLLMGRGGAGLTWGLDGWLVERLHPTLVLFPLRMQPPED